MRIWEKKKTKTSSYTFVAYSTRNGNRSYCIVKRNFWRIRYNFYRNGNAVLRKMLFAVRCSRKTHFSPMKKLQAVLDRFNNSAAQRIPVKLLFFTSECASSAYLRDSINRERVCRVSLLELGDKMRRRDRSTFTTRLTGVTSFLVSATQTRWRHAYITYKLRAVPALFFFKIFFFLFIFFFPIRKYDLQSV